MKIPIKKKVHLKKNRKYIEIYTVTYLFHKKISIVCIYIIFRFHRNSRKRFIQSINNFLRIRLIIEVVPWSMISFWQERRRKHMNFLIC